MKTMFQKNLIVRKRHIILIADMMTVNVSEELNSVETSLVALALIIGWCVFQKNLIVWKRSM